MEDLKTNPAVLEALRQHTRQTLSRAELHDQRVSFIMANVKGTSTVTRQRVEEVLAASGGTDRLDTVRGDK